MPRKKVDPRERAGLELRQLRIAKDRTLEDLGHETGLAFSTISRMERGVGSRAPTFEAVGVVLAALDAPLETVLRVLLGYAGYDHASVVRMLKGVAGAKTTRSAATGGGRKR